jgi:NhaP-type Na+/H+ or K+/H+ antiporter/CRP-like cAMP-binding protein
MTDSEPSGHEASHSEEAAANGTLFFVLCLALGLLCRTVVTKLVPFPYTVILMSIGVLLGVLAESIPASQLSGIVKAWAEIDPELILFVFLPVLIFESGYSIDFHAFKRSFWQIFALAVPGLVIGALLTGAAFVGVFPYNWHWPEALLVGSILSATDPVAVVALLKELKASKHLETVIEGESLMNDGTAIIAFALMRSVLLGESRTASEMVLFGAQLSLVGPVIGAVIAIACSAFLSRVFNDPVSEITVTLASCYAGFLLAEGTFLRSSGVLTVVTIGLLTSAYGRLRISPAVEESMHSFWEMMSYIANTVIFVLSGVLIVEKTLYSDAITGTDWGYLLLLFLLLLLIRAVVVLCVYPCLRCSGYKLSWKDLTVLTYAGLRGAVGLSLGLIVGETTAFDTSMAAAYQGSEYDHDFREHALFLIAGIAFFTLLINGSTTKLLLKHLGMVGESEESRVMFEQASIELNQQLEDRVEELSRDPQYAHSNWRQLWTYVNVPTQSVYSARKAKGLVFAAEGEIAELVPPHLRKRWKRFATEFDVGLPRQRLAGPCCSSAGASSALRVSSPLFAAEVSSPAPGGSGMLSEARKRLLGAIRGGFWKRFHEGRASKETVKVLLDAVDWQLDQPSDTVLCMFSDALKPSVEPSLLVRWLHSFHALGWLLKPILFGQLQLLYDATVNFIEVYDAVKPRVRSWASMTTTEQLLGEVAFERAGAMDMLSSMQIAFPSVLRAVQTSHAVRAILQEERSIIEGLRRDGALEDSQAEGLLEKNNASMKKALQHPVVDKLLSASQVINSSHLARNVPPDVLGALKLSSKRRLVQSGVALFRAGERATGIYIVISGALRAVVPRSGPDELSSSELRSTSDVQHSTQEGAGQVLGILPSLLGTRQVFTVTALAPSEVLFVPTECLESMMRANEAACTNVWALAAAQVAGLFLDSFSEHSRATILRTMLQGTLILPWKTGDAALPDTAASVAAAAKTDEPTAASSRALRAIRAGGRSARNLLARRLSATIEAGAISPAEPASPVALPSDRTPSRDATIEEMNVGSATSMGYGHDGWIFTGEDHFILLRGSLVRTGDTSLPIPITAFRTIHPSTNLLRFSPDSLLFRVPAAYMPLQPQSSKGGARPSVVIDPVAIRFDREDTDVRSFASHGRAGVQFWSLVENAERRRMLAGAAGSTSPDQAESVLSTPSV